MRKNQWFRTALASLVAFSSSTAAWAHAEIFSDSDFEKAQQQAQKDGKYLLIDFTATWCPPCKMMESSTWSNPDVQKWVKENAIAVQIDVDKDRKTSSAFHIEAMPTMVLFKPQNTTSEFGRQLGYMEPAELLRWLNGAKSGKSAEDLEKDEDTLGENAVFEHFGKAREFQTAGKNSEALDEYLWIWENTPNGNPHVTPIKMAAAPLEIKKLVAVFPAAKTKFSELRDAAEKANNREDWIVLNTALDDNARTLAWFDKAKLDPKQVFDIQSQSALLESVLFNKSRWNDLVNYLYPNPIQKINDYYKRAQDEKKPRPDTEFSKGFDAFPSMVMLMYGAYVGAGKDAEAQKIATECLRLDDCAAMREGLKNMEKGMRMARAPQSAPKNTNKVAK